MKYIISLFFVLSSTMLWAQNGETNFLNVNYMEVTGKAEIEIVPDEIYLSIVIDEDDSKGKISVEQKEKKFYACLKDLKIDVDEDLAVKDFISNFKDHWLKKTDIRTRKEYQLIVHDSQTLSRLFVELEEIGISNINIDKVDHSQMENFRKEVKVKAIKAAKEKANYLALAINQNAGRALFIQEYNNNYRQMNAMASNVMIRGTASYDKKEALPNIEFQKIKLEASIMVRFALD